MRHKGGHSRRAAASLAPLAAALFLVTPALAGQVGYPKAAPKIELRVPDDWTVSESELGLEIESPRKDCLVVAALLPRDKVKVDKWVQQAAGRMKAEGVIFLNKDGSEPDLPDDAPTPTFEAPSATAEPSGPGETFTFSRRAGAREGGSSERAGLPAEGGHEIRSAAVPPWRPARVPL